ncbi:hypothetical protein [Actinacidiphila oryziradicis]|uniref:GIY-YIG nuclease family protein n=1 Tax=Actinacidiphila oryziradicis TaxID=2571141 RepID=A0A4U0S702_9ACTN|nr:hypothetical protein [Actinacidiphila oryziradicis]TKA04906.1 hypothetical protein FCI23_34070 [Actinacidiphila oryziradicis]
MPVPGQRLPGPLIRRSHIPLMRKALGHLARPEEPLWFRIDAVDVTSPGLYLVVDAAGRIVWMGMAAGDEGIAGRITMHLREEWKRTTFDRVWTFPAWDSVSRQELAAAESWAADALDLRSQMPDRTWPTVRPTPCPP